MNETPNDRHILIYLFISNFVLYFGFQVWQTMFNNYAVEEIGAGPSSIGLMQALREVPGLMGFLLAFLALYLSEVRIMALSIICLGLGLVLTGYASGVWVLLIATVVMSVGFHFFHTSSSSVVLMAVHRDQAAQVLGQLGSLGSLAAVAGTGVVYFLARAWGYRALFVVVGTLAVVGGALLLPLRAVGNTLPTQRQFMLRRRYWLYYTLSFLMGSRRHIFTTFAILLLVRDYGISIQTTALLFLVNSVLNIYGLRLIGRLVSHWGERLSLSFSFSTLVLVFLGYAFVSSLPVLFALFIADSLLFGFNIALTTYFQKIAVSPEEITSNVSAEQAINHIAAVVVPALGGAIWEIFGSQAPFLFGTGIVVISLVLAQFVPAAPKSVSAAPMPGS